jgi:hypothetical protein
MVAMVVVSIWFSVGVCPVIPLRLSYAARYEKNFITAYFIPARHLLGR